MNPIWRPYTQHLQAADPVSIDRAQGATLFSAEGKEILDLVSSWWVNVHGHCHPRIAEAIGEQARRLEHVLFAGLTHEPAERYARALLDQLGEPFSRLFFSDNGSTAVEVALKMALQEAINRGDAGRRKVIAFEGGFHGDTWAAMGVGRTSGFFQAIEGLLSEEVLFAPFPATWEGDARVEEKEQTALDALGRLLERHGSEAAGLVIEPLIQGASGMRMVRPGWLSSVVVAARAAGIRVIFDEVMTGFGRTGKMFAFQRLPREARPDIVCLSKGISGGFLPMAATVTHDAVYNAFLSEKFTDALVHGHSYTANPLACAAALASLELFETERTLERIAEQERVHRRMLPTLPNTHRHRALGAVAACDVATSEAQYGSKASVDLRQKFLQAGLLVRPLGNAFYLMPPACLTPGELEHAYERVAKVLAG